MDWPLIVSGATLALNAVVIGFWKPWLAGYGGEKGKNLARKEDLDAILAEVRAVTITQKEIEARLSSDMWDRQVRWNQKRDMYARLLEAQQKVSDAVAALVAFIPTQTAGNQEIRLHFTNVVSAVMDRFNAAHSELSHASAC